MQLPVHGEALVEAENMVKGKSVPLGNNFPTEAKREMLEAGERKGIERRSCRQQSPSNGEKRLA